MEDMYVNPSTMWNMPKLMTRDMSCAWIAGRMQNWTYGINGDAFLVGIPFDYAVNYRPGTRFGPNAIRQALAGQTMYVTDRRQDISSLTLVDVGDIDIVHDIQEDYSRIEKTIKAIAKDNLVIIMGGDHSISRPSIKAVAEKLDDNCKIGLIVFDAHFDSRIPVPGKEHSGHWLRQIQEEIPNKLQGDNIAIIGLSAGSYSKDYQLDADKRGILSFTSSEVRGLGVNEVVNQCLEHVCKGTSGVYISIDIDAIHQAFAPGTSVPNPLGIYPDVLLDCLFRISKEAHILGSDITELNPLFDNSNMTANIAAQAVLHILAGVAARRERCNEEK